MAASDNQSSFKCYVVIKASTAEVFKAITDGAELARWWPNDAEAEPRRGGKLLLSWGKDKIVAEGDRYETEFKTFDSPNEISFPFDGLVTFRLLPVDGGTKLQIMHDCPAERVVSVALGWGAIRLNLKTYLEHRMDLRSLWGSLTGAQTSGPTGVRMVHTAVEIKATPAAVFNVFAIGSELARWFPNWAETDPRPGGKVVLGWSRDKDPAKTTELEFKTFDPPNELSLTNGWTFRFSPTDGRTKVELTDECPADIALSVASHWGGLVVNLKTYLEHGLDLRSLWGWKD